MSAKSPVSIPAGRAGALLIPLIGTVVCTYQPVLGSHIRPVVPLWLDAGGCADSTWDVPAGPQSEKSRTWRSTVSGDVVHVRGHLHHGGVAVQTEDATTGRLFCRSEAEEGGTPEFVDHHGMTEVSNAGRSC